MARKVLEVRNLTKCYKVYHSDLDRLKEIFLKKKYHKTFVANDAITFDLYEGETLGIIGVNGAGKSTLLKQIAGVTEPTHGSIIRHGKVTALLELGTGFNDELSGMENIFLNGTLIGMSEDECEQKKASIIEFSELGEHIYQPVRTYSSGMKMRLAFSIAIFSEPKILIVDEALSVGDAHFSAKCTAALKQRKEKNMSIIYVSHDLNSLKILCDRVILLNAGKVDQDGEPEKTVNAYNYLIAKLNKSNQRALQKGDTYGSLDAQIKNVMILSHGMSSNTIPSGEKVILKAEIFANTDMKNVNLGFLIKDRYGQDIFGTATKKLGKTFDFAQNKTYTVQIQIPLNLGSGHYSVSAALALGDTHLDSCIHWIDYAAKFEIAGNTGSEFIGLCKLNPQIQSVEVQDE